MWWLKKQAKKRGKRVGNARQNNRRLRFEGLEDRRLLSADLRYSTPELGAVPAGVPLAVLQDPQVTPLDTEAPWYFWWLQGMLKIADKTSNLRAIRNSPNLRAMRSVQARDDNLHDKQFRNGMWVRIAWPLSSGSRCSAPGAAPPALRSHRGSGPAGAAAPCGTAVRSRR